jgi:formylglycine-generating enzyme required for sulfatase activity/tRNA A-37 threonylcarbamoyl transferase component Bud32
VTVARCPYCQQTIVGQIEGGDGGWTCPSCKRTVGTLVEPKKSDGAGQTIVESRPTPFRPEVVREESKAGGTIAVNPDAPLRTGPGGGDTLIGEVLGGCRILEVLGRGAMGTVYKATQLSLDRTVALKVIREELCLDDDLLTRFQREAKMVGRFSTPHVVQIHDVGRDKRVHFIVMEFVSGGSLLAHVNELPGRRLPPDQAIRYMIEASEGLLEAERLGIVHRDIKPENLLLDHAGRVKVADFGISRSVTMSVELTATQAVIGTPLYMSPEQCRAEKVDHRSDMYSLGATFCHMLAGKRPLHEESVQELLRKKTTMEFLSPRRLAQDGSIPESLSRVIERMTALDRADRYPSFKEVVEDLHRVERGELIEPFQRKAARERLRRRLVKSAAVALCLAAIGWSGWRLYDWWRARLPTPDPDGGSSVAAGVTAAQLAQEESDLRQQLIDPRLLTSSIILAKRDKTRRAVDGPDSEAATRLAKLCDDAERLVSYRENAQSVRPGTFKPPFSDLEERWRNLRGIAEAARPESSGREVRDFVGRDLDAKETSDRDRATTVLKTSLDDLERRVKEGLPTADARSAAHRDYVDLVAGRDALGRIFPPATGAFEAAPGERCDKLKKEIEKLEASAAAPSPEAALTEAQANKRIDELKQEFQTSGPNRVMEEDAKAMRARLPEGSTARTSVGKFLDLVTHGSDVVIQLENLRNQQPPQVRVAFDDLAAFAGKCRGAIQYEANDPDWYRRFFDDELARRLKTYRESSRDLYTKLVGDWRKAAAAIASGAGDAAAFSTIHQQVADSRKNLTTAFGADAKFTTELLPEEEFGKAARDFDALAALRGRIGDGLKALDEAAKGLDAVNSSAAWREHGPKEIAPKIELARKSIDEVRKADARAVDAATMGRLADVEGRAKRWSDAVGRIEEVLGHVKDDHDLAAAKRALDAITGAADDPSVKQARSAVDQLQNGFRALFEKLDVKGAGSAFGEAQIALAEAAPGVRYATDARARLDELDLVVKRGMARVLYGKVKLAASTRSTARGSSPVDVAAFWLDPCAVSIEEFQAFLKELPADRELVETLLPSLPGFEKSSADESLQRLSAAPSSVAGAGKSELRLPAHSVSYAQAVVYLARQGKQLPTLEEWWLAAKGSLDELPDHRRFPWNDSPTARLDRNLDPEQVCARMKRPMAVDEGGIALGFGTIKVHHLSGNVQQWTQAVPGSGGRPESRVIGGSFDDDDEGKFSGEQPRFVSVEGDEYSNFSIGFRGVLRPRDFFAAKKLAPKGI